MLETKLGKGVRVLRAGNPLRTITLLSVMAMFLAYTTIPAVSKAQLIQPPSGTTEYPWLTGGYDHHGTSFTPGPGPKSNHLLWKRNLGYQPTAPVVSKGIVHVGTAGADLWALDAATGETIWSEPPMGSRTGMGRYSTVAIMQVRDQFGVQWEHDELAMLAGGSIFVHDALTGRLLRIIEGPDEATGEMIVYNRPAEVNGQPLIFAGGNNHSWVVGYQGNLIYDRVGPSYRYAPTLFEGPDGTGLYVAEGASNAHAYTFALPGHEDYIGWDNPANWPEKYYPGYFAVYDVSMEWVRVTWGGNYEIVTATKEPEVLWEYATELEGTNFPISQNGKIFFGSTLWNSPLKEKPPPGTAYPGSFICWDAYSGELLWETTWTVVGNEPATPSTHFAYAYGKVFMGCYDGNFYCIDENTGDIAWWREGIGGMTYNGPQVADGLVYEGGTQWRVFGVPATIYALNATTGDTVWLYRVPTPPKYCNGAVADGRYYTGTTDGWFYCFGSGPTKTTLDLSTKQFRPGQTILISGQVRDISPSVVQGAEPEYVADAPVMLMAVPLGGTSILNIGTVTTSASGDYYTEWTVPEDLVGKYSLVANFAENERYEASSATTTFIVGAEVGTEELVQQVREAILPTLNYAPLLYTVIAISIVAVIIGLYNTIAIRKQQK